MSAFTLLSYPVQLLRFYWSQSPKAVHILGRKECVSADVPLDHAEDGLALCNWNEKG